MWLWAKLTAAGGRGGETSPARISVVMVVVCLVLFCVSFVSLAVMSHALVGANEGGRTGE